ncbi:MAG: hypothetical protein RLZZ142_1499 [Verrucomicrobiota bacterium]
MDPDFGGFGPVVLPVGGGSAARGGLLRLRTVVPLETPQNAPANPSGSGRGGSVVHAIADGEAELAAQAERGRRCYGLGLVWITAPGWIV